MREILISLSNNNITTAEYHQNIRFMAVFIWGCRGVGVGRCESCLFVCVKISRCQDFIYINREIIINSANMYYVNLLPKRFRLSASSEV